MAPINLTVEQGDAWQVNDEFNVTWHTPPGQESPIAVAHYELCPAVPLGPCVYDEVADEGITAASIVVPSLGWFWLRVWLEDASGNVDPNAASDPVMVRFDDEAPPAGEIQPIGGWLNANSPADMTLVVQMGAADVSPLSGIKGYSITSDGSIPDATIDAPAAQDNERWRGNHVFSATSDGVTELKIRSVSNSGVISVEPNTATIRIDREAPSLSAAGLDDLGSWRREPVEASFTGHDQVHLSGMVPAPLDAPIEDGAYLSFNLDGGSAETVRGAHAATVISSDGAHTLQAQAVDRAGNPSALLSWDFKIDQTPPVGAFERRDAADPRRVAVSISDATSGLATGRIEYRRVGENDFTLLPSSLQAGTLVGRLDDLALANGRYEFRAIAEDVAGNAAVIDQMADGDRMTLDLPVRTPTALAIRSNKVTKRCVMVKRRRKAKTRVVKTCRNVVGGTDLAYGKRLPSVGRLTGTDGAGVPNAPIAIEAQPRSGGAVVRLGSARTDSQGAFSFAIPPGSSRTVRYRYEGTDTNKPVSADLGTKVAAAARLLVDRRRLRNGQAVRFTGRLLGKPIPKTGKVVALQAKVGRRWRTFATPRANSKGIFKHRYRFTATTGVRRYAFRALVTREAAYPYERGLSKQVRVVVRGR